SPLIKLVGRGDTTVVDAYLSPILQRYVAEVSRELGTDSAARSASPSELAAATAPRLMFMMASGGLTAAELVQGKDAILSGPAGAYRLPPRRPAPAERCRCGGATVDPGPRSDGSRGGAEPCARRRCSE